MDKNKILPEEVCSRSALHYIMHYTYRNLGEIEAVLYGDWARPNDFLVVVVL